LKNQVPYSYIIIIISGFHFFEKNQIIAPKKLSIPFHETPTVLSGFQGMEESLLFSNFQIPITDRSFDSEVSNTRNWWWLRTDQIPAQRWLFPQMFPKTFIHE
jgi:hypothetical protein